MLVSKKAQMTGKRQRKKYSTAAWEKYLHKKKNKKKSYAKLSTRSHLYNVITYFGVYEK